MALQIAPRPEAALALVTQELTRMATGDTFLTPRLRAARSRTLAVSTWLPSYSLILEKILVSSDLSSCCQDCGWTFLVHGPNDVLATIETCHDSFNRSALGPLREGPVVDGLVAALNQAEGISRADGHAHQPTLLIAAPIYLNALWLRRADGLDWILPLPPLPPPTPLLALQPLRPAPFVGILRPLVQQCLASAAERRSESALSR